MNTKKWMIMIVKLKLYMKSTDAINLLKVRGKKVTVARQAIIEIFCSVDSPVKAKMLQLELKRLKIEVNKSTIYRELSFLVEENIIKEVHLTQGVVHYELASLPHHHHLSCTSCGKIKEVYVDSVEEQIDKLKDSIASRGFKINRHNLEFYGTCSSCT